jgi:hypothetical protein
MVQLGDLTRVVVGIANEISASVSCQYPVRVNVVECQLSLLLHAAKNAVTV